MAMYVSIRGWIEYNEDDMLSKIRAVLDQSVKHADGSRHRTMLERAENLTSYWTSVPSSFGRNYIFLAYDDWSLVYEFFMHQLKQVAKVIFDPREPKDSWEYIQGYFRVNFEDGRFVRCEIWGGEVHIIEDRDWNEEPSKS